MRRTSFIQWTYCCLAVASWLVVPAPAATQELRLPAGLGSETRALLESEIDDAEAAGLPGRALVLKALEGRSKGATEAQIVSAVRALHQRLEVAAEVVGLGRGEDVLLSAAGALYVGVERADLEEITEKTRDEALGMALVVLGDLVRRGVPVSQASHAVVVLGAAGVDAPTLGEFRRRVDDDIRTGLAPVHATDVRVRGVLASRGGSGARR